MQKLCHWHWQNEWKKEPFKIDLWTGASVGDEADGALTRANGINRRFPYQTNKDMRKL